MSQPDCPDELVVDGRVVFTWRRGPCHGNPSAHTIAVEFVGVPDELRAEGFHVYGMTDGMSREEEKEHIERLYRKWRATGDVGPELDGGSQERHALAERISGILNEAAPLRGADGTGLRDRQDNWAEAVADLIASAVMRYTVSDATHGDVIAALVKRLKADFQTL